MNPANIFQLEMAMLFAGKKTLFMKLGLTLLIGFPFIFIDMPPAIKRAGLLVLLIFISFFGSSVAMVRRRTEGHLKKIATTPIPKRVWFFDYLLANVTVDVMQIGLVMLLSLIINRQSTDIVRVVTGAALFLLTITVYNVLGMALGLSLKSNSEVHLFGALGVAFLVLLSGALPVPDKLESVVYSVARWAPAYHLSRLMLPGGSGGFSLRGIALLLPLLVIGCFIAFLLLRGADRRQKIDHQKCTEGDRL